MSLKFTNEELQLLILFIIIVFLKKILDLIIYLYYKKYFKINNKNYDTLKNVQIIYANIITICYIIISIYIVLIKGINNKIYLFYSFILFFKAFMYFLVDFEIYKKLNLSLKSEKRLIMLKNIEVVISNIILGLTALYILKTIF